MCHIVNQGQDLNASYAYGMACVSHPGNAASIGVILENASHPEDVSVAQGEEAVFQCTVSYLEPASAALEFSVLIEVSPPHHVLGNRTVFNTCTTELGVAVLYNITTGNCSYLQTERRDIASNSLSHVVVYTIRIPKASANLNGSTVACSLRNRYLQWRRVAELTIYPPTIVMNNQVSAVTIAVSLTLVLLLLIGVLLAVVAPVVILCRRRKKTPLISQDKSKCP